MRKLLCILLALLFSLLPKGVSEPMAYENVTAPALQEYDTAAYPYYVLMFSYELDAADWYQVQFFGSPTAFYYDTDAGCITITETSHLRQIYDTESASWGSATLEVTPTLTPGYSSTGQTYHRIWTNHDILDSEGNVWLAADSVTPVEEETEETTKWPGLKSWLAGLVIGLAGKVVPMNARTPVAYSYNDVVLPALPEWDREAYPYAVLRAAGSPGYMLICSASETTYSVSANKYTTTGPAVVYVLPYKDDAGEWVDLLEQEWQFYAEYSGEHSFTLAFWTNTDILNEDGTTYLAASDPIPVYE